MTKNPFLFLGALIGTVLIWRLLSDRERAAFRKLIYSRMRRASFSVTAKSLLKQLIKETARAYLS